jgi:hypothetical protein
MNEGVTRTTARWIAMLVIVMGTQAGLKAQHLRWDNPNPPGHVQSYTVSATGPLPSASVRKLTLETNQVDLRSLLALAPAGRYSLAVVSNGTNKMSSQLSKPLFITWGSPSARTVAKLPCENVFLNRENRGVVYQTLHDQLHTYAATSFKADSNAQVCKVALQLRKFHNPAGDLTFHLWSDNKGKPAALLATSSVGINLSQMKDEWCEAELRFNVLQGQTYWVGFSGSAPSPADNLLWIGGGPGARCHSADGLTWVFGSADAMNLRLYGSP